MTRLGWIIFGIILVAAGLFASMLSFGPTSPVGISPRMADALPFARERPGPGMLVIPVAGYPQGALRSSWGEARDGGERGHHGIDLMAAAGTSVVAAAGGRVEKLFESGDGGTTLYVRSPDAAWSYYYAHLAGYAPGVREGARVRAGDPIGYVGDSGNAGPGNTHLHFGVSRMRAGERWWQGEAVDPYPLLAGTAAGR
ncbi:M23 family metallopeptidase [Sphingomonas rubra]|uniref:Peptidase family M23 n=1 Tax=Sphingomonas rubra TaxID=634430 RepID=A0A1I5RZX2_9SPHN|nr:M23 family metallopeptidase [Sphingomonas rubra]SFP63954.1 Peptidase family M23 [Sphingomonas rubra]